MDKQLQPTTFIDPFVDFSFKRLFSTDESKPVLIGFLNHLFQGRKYITSIEYTKNEYPGEIADEGGAIFDVVCTDIDGSRFIIEIQRGHQKYFKERALFYTSRAISEQAPKGNRRDWGYQLTEVYLIAFLDDFNLPDTSREDHLQDICLADRQTGKIFYDKLGFTFLQMLNFVKKPDELETDLEKWLYALKHLPEFTEQPEYLNGAEFDRLFNLAKYANLNRKERDMYNASLKYKWDNKNVRDYAEEMGLERGLQQGLEQGLEKGLQQGIEEGLQQGLEQGLEKGLQEGLEKGFQQGRNEERAKALQAKNEIARNLKNKNIAFEIIADATGLSIKEISAL